MEFFIVVALVVAISDAHVIVKRSAGDQQPKIWDALKDLRGGKDLTVQEIQDLLNNAVAGTDYPINAIIPNTQIDCKSYKQPGFYVDDSSPSKCQIFHRCDENGNVNSFLCPNQTLFNQITLICDWFVNIDCRVSKKYQDYSNSRLADENAHLLDDQMEIGVVEEATGAVSSQRVIAPPVLPKPAAHRKARTKTTTTTEAPEDSK